MIQLGRAKAAQLKRTNKEVSWTIPEWLAARKCHETSLFIGQFGGLFNQKAVNKILLVKVQTWNFVS